MEWAGGGYNHLQLALEGHLEVEPHKLAEVAARVGVLGAEDGRHLKDAIQVGRDRHLLVQLRRLREARRAPEVVGAEHLGPALRLARDQFGRVDLDKAALEQRLRAPRSLRFSRAPSGRTQRASVGDEGALPASSRAAKRTWLSAVPLSATAVAPGVPR